MNFQKYVVYSLRPYFSTQPGHPKYCLHCSNDLSIMNIEPSLSVKDDIDHCNQLYTSHDFSLLYIYAITAIGGLFGKGGHGTSTELIWIILL